MAVWNCVYVTHAHKLHTLTDDVASPPPPAEPPKSPAPLPQQLRLVQGGLAGAGMVQVYSLKYGWGLVQYNAADYTPEMSLVACRQLGYHNGTLQVEGGHAMNNNTRGGGGGYKASGCWSHSPTHAHT